MRNSARQWAFRVASGSDIGFLIFLYPTLLLPLLGGLFPARNRRSQRETLRVRWGKARPADAAMDRASLYHRRCPTDPAGYTIDDQTWGDLDLDAVFRRIDHTSSAVGRQVLYQRLRSPRDEEGSLRALDRLARYLAEQEAVRIEVQESLTGLDAGDAFELPRLFAGSLPEARLLRWLFPLMTALTLGALATVPFLAGWALIWPLLALAVNIVLGLHFRRRLADIVPALKPLQRLIATGERLGGFEGAPLEDALGSLRDDCARLRRVKRACAYLIFENHFNELAASFYAYLNTFFLADLNAIAATLHRLEKDRALIRRVYETIGHIDAALALASLRQALPHYCTPEFMAREKQVAAADLYHPLLDEPVANTIAISEKGVLVYGANMSGKTTFIRALALCSILAQALYTCPAGAYRAPFLRTRSLINRKDDILGGKSYFLAEAEAVGDLVQAATASGPQYLFAVDELFKGTNPREGRAATRAVLDYLDAGDHIALVATHDARLQTAMGSNWDVYHFDARVETGTLVFDYRLRSGKAGAGNAIEVLAACGYPATVLDAARKYLREEAE